MNSVECFSIFCIENATGVQFVYNGNVVALLSRGGNGMESRKAWKRIKSDVC